MTTEADRHATSTSTLHEALDDLDRRLQDGAGHELWAVPTGFEVLDEVLGGGLRAGELLLLGGPPGVGKTICALQWARNLARSGRQVVFANYEHEPATLLLRLLSLEVGETGGEVAALRSLERELAGGSSNDRPLSEVLASAGGAAALDSLRAYADNMTLVRASGAHTGVDELGEVVGQRVQKGAPTVLFVDYLQKIPLRPEPDSEAEKVTRTVEALKDLALDLHVPVVLVSAVDADGMRSSRLRMYHLRGSSAIAFESDVVIMLNDKMKALSKVHLSYDAVRARTFREWVVFSLEKNRGGPNLIDLEFRKDFVHFRFDPEGGIVAERLVTERLDEDHV